MRIIHLYGTVGAEITEELIRRELKAARNGPVQLRLNSGGGDVFVGNTIASLLEAYSGRVEVFVDGLAASAASYLCMAANHIVMARGAFMMIHEPRANTSGTFEELRSLSDTVEKIRNTYADVYATRTGQPIDDVRAMMRDETWLTAEEAVELGFADEVRGRASRLAASAHLDEFRNVPHAVKQLAAHGRPRLAEARAAMALAGWGAIKSLTREANRTRVHSCVHKPHSKSRR